MSKVLQILKNHDTREKLEYLELCERKEFKEHVDYLLTEARKLTLYGIMRKQADLVLNGECPCEKECIGSTTRTVSPRDWMTYSEEVGVYGPCKFCGKD